MIRACVIRSAVIALLFACLVGASCGRDGEVGSPTSEADETAPDAALALAKSASFSAPSRYDVTVSGTVSVGTGRTSFKQNATLYLRRTFDTTGVTNNGTNAVEVGFKTAGNPLVGNAGALWFGTNTSMSAEIGSSNAIAASSVDVARVSIKGSKVTAALDGDAFGLPNARINYLNVYNAKSSVTAQIYFALSGQVTASFSDKGRKVSGSINLGGSSGFSSGAVTSTYKATFKGSRV